MRLYHNAISFPAKLIQPVFKGEKQIPANYIGPGFTKVIQLAHPGDALALIKQVGSLETE